MPVGRVYQAPTTLNTVSRNTPVYGFNGIKTVSNTDLVITGKAVRSTKSKSKSPSPSLNTLTLSSSNSSISSKQLITNGTKKLTRKSKSPSPRKTSQLKSSNNRTESNKNDATVVETDINNPQAGSSSNNNGSVSAKSSPEQTRNIKAASKNEDLNNNQKSSQTLNNDNYLAITKTNSKTQVWHFSHWYFSLELKLSRCVIFTYLCSSSKVHTGNMTSFKTKDTKEATLSASMLLIISILPLNDN